MSKDEELAMVVELGFGTVRVYVHGYLVICSFKENGNVWGSDELWLWLGYVLNWHGGTLVVLVCCYCMV